MTLKQTNDDLNEEVTELRSQMNEQAEKVQSSVIKMKTKLLTLASTKTSLNWFSV